MSESTARAERRALRRVVGPELLSFTEDTTQAIRTLQAGVTTLHERVDALRDRHVALDNCVNALIPLLQVDGGFRGIEALYARLDGLMKALGCDYDIISDAYLSAAIEKTEARLDAHAGTLVRLTDQHRAFTGRSFLARLRWLIFGG